MTEAVATPKKKAAKAPKKAQEDLYAVFSTGGKQYRVQAGDRLKIEILPGEHKEGDKLAFDSVLMTDNGGSEVTLGNPFIAGAAVSATLKKIGRAKKVTVIKYKQKSRYFKKNGHRQPYFEIEIDSVK
jgi:large subunit ribosomal protein L21